LTTYELDLVFGVRETRAQSELNALNLLGDSTEDTFFESIEFVEATPCSHLTETDKDATHRLEVESFVTAENKDETTKGDSECFD